MDKFMKLKDYLLELAFLALLIRVVAVGCSVGEAIALVSVVSSMGYNKFLAKKKVEQYDEILSQIKTNHDDISKKYDDVVAKLASITMEKSIKRTVNEPQERSNPGAAPKRYF